MEYDIASVGAGRVLTLDGRVTFKEQSAFRTLLDAFFAEDAEPYILDLGAVTLIDSAGLGLLLIARRNAQTKGADIILRRPPPEVRMTLELAKFQDLFTIEP